MVDTYEGNFIERRALTWTLDFTLKGYVFGPTLSSSQIKRSIINIYNVGTDEAMSSAVANTPIYDTITTIPVGTGKTLNEIEADDDYTFSQTITQLYE